VRRCKSHHAHFPVEFLVVANEAGRQEFFNPAGWTDFIDALKHHGAHVGETSPDFAMFTEPPQQPVVMPRVVSTPADFTRVPAQPPLPAQRARAGAFRAFPDATTRQFVWDQACIFYTDGSQKDGKLGAGVVFPSPRDTDPRCLEVLTDKQGSSTTAELIAHAYVVRLPDTPTQETIICTDSLAGMLAIRNAIIDPRSILGSKDEAVLRTILAALKRRKGPSRFVKVKAHVGLERNELADKAAECARLRSTPTPHNDVVVAPPDDEPQTLIDVKRITTGASCTKEDVPAICADARMQAMEADYARLVDAAAEKALEAAAAAAAGPSGFAPAPAAATRQPPLTTALLWARAVTREAELIPHSETGFDKVRMGFAITRTEERKPQKERAETLQLALRSVKGRCGLANTLWVEVGRARRRARVSGGPGLGVLSRRRHSSRRVSAAARCSSRGRRRGPRMRRR
jgi:ribonuclease HI